MPRVTCPQCNKNQEPKDVSLLDWGWLMGKLALDPVGSAFGFTKGLYEAISCDHIFTKLCKCRHCNTLFSVCPHCLKTQVISDIHEIASTQKCLYCYRHFQVAMDAEIPVKSK